jgi:hypothetical protein
MNILFNKRQKVLRIFDMAVGFWVLLHAYKHYGIKDILYSPYNFCPLPKTTWPYEIDIIFYNFFGYNWFSLGIALQVLLGLIFIIFGSSFISRILLFFISLNLFKLCGSISDGGNDIFLNLMLIYIFCPKIGSKKVPDFMQELLFFGVIVSMQYQVILIYIQAALSKIRTDGWSTGIALHYIFQQPEFSNPFFASIIMSNDWLIVLGTYATVVFQVLFLPAMFNKHLKLIWLFLGVGFHLGILLTMNLVTFSLFMIVAYILFLNDSDLLSLKSMVKESKQTIKAIN